MKLHGPNTPEGGPEKPGKNVMPHVGHVLSCNPIYIHTMVARV